MSIKKQKLIMIVFLLFCLSINTACQLKKISAAKLQKTIKQTNTQLSQNNLNKDPNSYIDNYKGEFNDEPLGLTPVKRTLNQSTYEQSLGYMHYAVISNGVIKLQLVKNTFNKGTYTITIKVANTGSKPLTIKRANLFFEAPYGNMDRPVNPKSFSTVVVEGKTEKDFTVSFDRQKMVKGNCMRILVNDFGWVFPLEYVGNQKITDAKPVTQNKVNEPEINYATKYINDIMGNGKIKFCLNDIDVIGKSEMHSTEEKLKTNLYYGVAKVTIANTSNETIKIENNEIIIVTMSPSVFIYEESTLGTYCSVSKCLPNPCPIVLKPSEIKEINIPFNFNNNVLTSIDIRTCYGIFCIADLQNHDK